MLRRLFTTNKLKTSLGRWRISKISKEQNKNIEIKIAMANHDSCGGKSCETPTDLKNEINKIIEK